MLQRQSSPLFDPEGLAEFASQLTQPAVPVAPLNVPTPQMVHEPPSGPEKPALQIHCEAAVEPAGLSLFVGSGQGVHSASPAAVLYMPAAQGMHEGELIPSLSYPASHHPDWKVSTAALEGSPVPVTARRVTQSEESLPGEGEATLLPWSLKSLGRALSYEPGAGVIEKREMATGRWNDI